VALNRRTSFACSFRGCTRRELVARDVSDMQAEFLSHIDSKGPSLRLGDRFGGRCRLFSDVTKTTAARLCASGATGRRPSIVAAQTAANDNGSCTIL